MIYKPWRGQIGKVESGNRIKQGKGLWFWIGGGVMAKWDREAITEVGMSEDFEDWLKVA